MDDKATLRRRMKMVRDLVDDHMISSVKLWARVAALPEYDAADTVMAFVGFKGEPETDPLFARLAADGKRLLLPRIQDGEIHACTKDERGTEKSAFLFIEAELQQAAHDVGEEQQIKHLHGAVRAVFPE